MLLHIMIFAMVSAICRCADVIVPARLLSLARPWLGAPGDPLTAIPLYSAFISYIVRFTPAALPNDRARLGGCR